MDEKDELEEKTEGNEKEEESKEETVDVEKLGGVDLDTELHDLKSPLEEAPEKKIEEKKEVKEVKSEPTAKEKEFEERVARLERDKSDLKKALHEARQERKKAKEAEPQVTLTDAELMKIVEEHKDDPKVMFNAVAYKVQQMMKTGKAEAVNEVEIKQKRGELDKILKERIRDYEDESSEPRILINRAKADFSLEDHPYSDFLATSAAVYMDLPNLIKSWIEEGKKQALNEKADDVRKNEIKKTQLTPGGAKAPAGKGKDEGLTASQMETAKRLGFTTPEKLKLYRSQILKGISA